MTLSDIAVDLMQRVEVVERDEGAIGVMSTGERLAVALVLDRRHLLEGYTILEAIDRLGEEWTRAAIYAQRARR